MYFFLFLFLGLLGYLFFLQWYSAAFYREKCIKNFLRKRRLESFRGAIRDRKGILLASTIPVMCLQGNQKKKYFNEKEKRSIELISNITGVSLSTEQPLPSIIKSSISFEEFCSLLDQLPNSDLFTVSFLTHRIYHCATTACHLIGYIHADTKRGMTGVENIYNESLVGVEGVQTALVNAQGKVIGKTQTTEAFSGNDITLTLDLSLQQILESVIPPEVQGCGIIMNPLNGNIIAMVSSPRFAPELFLKKISQKNWEEFVEKKTFINRCFQATYSPGSIFKLIVAIALLEEKLIDESTEWFCQGFTLFKGRALHCHYKQGHGIMNIATGLAYSCNIPFFEMAKKKLTIEMLASYASLFEFGEKTGIIFKEKVGCVPNKQWKKRVKKERWYTGDTLNIAIGQGDLQVTPLQITRFMGALTTGFLVQPRITEHELIVKKKIPLSVATINIIKKSIYQAAYRGTSSILASLITSWIIFPKTATVQVCALSKEDNEQLPKHHGIFTCYARYKNDEPMILTIVLEHAGSSRTAVQCAFQFFKQYEALTKR